MRGSPELLDEVVRLAGELTGQPAVLVEDLSFSSRAVIARVGFGDGGRAIAKRPFEQSAFASELEAFRLLPADARPALIGTASGTLVMEDVGAGPSLADLLLGSDRGSAELALHAWARTLGGALKATMRTGVPTVPFDYGAGMEHLVGLADDLQVTVPAGVGHEAAGIRELLSAASPWLAYCPGDTCPDNNRVLGDGSVRLFDFEGSGWRHTATEAAYCRAPFCTCWCLAALPAGVTTAMESEFLAALDPPQPEEFRSTIALAAVAWTLSSFDYFRRFVHTGGPTGANAHRRSHAGSRQAGRDPRGGAPDPGARPAGPDAERRHRVEVAGSSRRPHLSGVPPGPAVGSPPEEERLDREAVEPVLWAVAGCLFEVSLVERAGATWHWADPPPGVTLLGESVRGDQRHFRFRAEEEGEVALRFRGRTAERGVVLRSVLVHVAPEQVAGAPEG